MALLNVVCNVCLDNDVIDRDYFDDDFELDVDSFICDACIDYFDELSPAYEYQDEDNWALVSVGWGSDEDY